MTMMRANPLPSGKYWVDVFQQDQGAFRVWLADHDTTVHVENTEYHLADSEENPARTWYLFTVLSPTPWNGPGFPTVADDTVNQSSDTGERPPPPSGAAQQAGEVLDAVEAAAREAGGAIKTVGTIAAILAAGWIVAKVVGK